MFPTRQYFKNYWLWWFSRSVLDTLSNLLMETLNCCYMYGLFLFLHKSQYQNHDRFIKILGEMVYMKMTVIRNLFTVFYVLCHLFQVCCTTLVQRLTQYYIMQCQRNIATLSLELFYRASKLTGCSTLPRITPAALHQKRHHTFTISWVPGFIHGHPVCMKIATVKKTTVRFKMHEGNIWQEIMW